jgi:hypothetical protein
MLSGTSRTTDLDDFRHQFAPVPRTMPRVDVDRFIEQVRLLLGDSRLESQYRALTSLVSALENINAQLKRCDQYRNVNGSYINTYLHSYHNAPVEQSWMVFRKQLQDYYRDAANSYEPAINAHAAFSGGFSRQDREVRELFGSLLQELNEGQEAMDSAAKFLETRNDRGLRFEPRVDVPQEVRTSLDTIGSSSGRRSDVAIRGVSRYVETTDDEFFDAMKLSEGVMRQMAATPGSVPQSSRRGQQPTSNMDPALREQVSNTLKDVPIVYRTVNAAEFEKNTCLNPDRPDKRQSALYRKITKSLNMLENSLSRCVSMRSENEREADEYLRQYEARMTFGGAMNERFATTEQKWKDFRGNLLKTYETALQNYTVAIAAIDQFRLKKPDSKRSAVELNAERTRLQEQRDVLDGDMRKLRQTGPTIGYIINPSLEEIYGPDTPPRRGITSGNSSGRGITSGNSSGTRSRVAVVGRSGSSNSYSRSRGGSG